MAASPPIEHLPVQTRSATRHRVPNNLAVSLTLGILTILASSLAFSVTPNDYFHSGWKWVNGTEVSRRKDCMCLVLRLEKDGKTVVCEVPPNHWPTQNCLPAKEGPPLPWNQ